MTRRLLTACVLMAISFMETKAQMDVQFSDFTSLKSYFNPAVSGIDGKLNVSAAYSMQMAGYDDAPSTMYVGGDLPIYFLGPRHGGGISLLTDNFGMFSSTLISAKYAYNMKIGTKGRLAIGAAVGMLSEKMDGSKAELEDSNDPAFPSSSVDGNHLDFNFGAYFTMSDWWGGVSVLHALGPTVTVGEKYEVEYPQSYYLMGGGNIKMKNPLLTLQPSFLVMTDLQSWREDLQCKVVYEYEERKLYGGLGYSPNVSATFMVGGVFHGITLGYSYQLFTHGLGMVNGSHELVMGYQTDLDLFRKGRNRHKSVRWL